MKTPMLVMMLFLLPLATFAAGYSFGSAEGRERTDQAIAAGEDALASLTSATTSLESCTESLKRAAALPEPPT